MISINNLIKEQMQIAIELLSTQEFDNICDEQAKKAYTLYMGLQQKPDWFKGPDKVKPKKVNKTYETITTNFFKIPERIIYLRNWSLNILPFIDLFSEIGKLPLTRKIDFKDDFLGYIEEVFNNYRSMLQNIHCTIPIEYSIMTNEDLKNTNRLCDKIIDSIREYYKGFPDKAYSELRIGIVNHLSIPEHLKNTMKLTGSITSVFYKMRLGTEYTFNKDEMFHIPLERRGLVSTNRYSIPGLPCVYLGSTPLTCWEELNKPDLNTVQTSLFVSKNINYLDLSIPPAELIGDLIHKFHLYGGSNMKKIYTSLRDYIVLWPLIAACSVRVQNKNDSFKPEYIIPQLLLQFIRQSRFDGISYFSTKIDNYSFETAKLYKNFAFPVQELAKKGLCPILQKKFDVTDAIPWQMFKLYKDSALCTPTEIEGNKRIDTEFIDGMNLLYSSTDFAKLENLLHNKFTLEKSE
ncbi:hypothetical protein JG486_30225 (plasmid) [Bacillus mycoides]|nr:hypothetical protein JG486_30225 [Bacillus mycoides]